MKDFNFSLNFPVLFILIGFAIILYILVLVDFTGKLKDRFRWSYFVYNIISYIHIILTIISFLFGLASAFILFLYILTKLVVRG